MNNKIFKILRIRFINQFGIAKLKDSDLSIKSHARITFVGYLVAFVLVLGYFLSLPMAMKYENMIEFTNPYVIGLLFWIITIWTCLSGIGNLIIGNDHDFIFTLPLKEYESKLFVLLYQYLIQTTITLIVLLGVQIALMIVHPFPLINILIILMIGIFIPIISLILNVTVFILVSFFLYKIHLKSIFLKTLLIFSMIIAPLIICYMKAGLENPKLGIIRSSILRYSLLKNINIEQCTILALALVLIISLLILFIQIVVKKYEAILFLIANSNSNNKKTSLGVKSQFRSLFKNEVDRYLSSFTYVTNTILMPVLLIIIGILSFIPHFKLIGNLSFNNFGIDINLSKESIYYILFTICISLTTSTSCSFSMEGDKVWIKQSLPISILKMSECKLLLNILLFLPGLIIAILRCIISSKIAVINMIILIISLVMNLLFISSVGLFLNLKFPNYEWSNEMEVVKQSLSTIITAVISMFLISVTAMIFVFLDMKYLVLPSCIELIFTLIFGFVISKKKYL